MPPECLLSTGTGYEVYQYQDQHHAEDISDGWLCPHVARERERDEDSTEEMENFLQRWKLSVS